MKLSQFKFKLNDEHIAKYPSEFRDDCKMMVVHRKTGEIEDKVFSDILSYFSPHDLFVMNDTKVFPARLYGKKEKTGATIEVFLVRELSREQHLWDVIVDPARKIRIGNKLYFGEDGSIVAEVIDNTTSRGRTLRFLYDGEYDDFKQQLFALGEAPLPNFINRPAEPEDMERFQTLFARVEGAVTAPSAGLHFSKILLKKMELYDIDTAFLTLHCGLGNFRSTDVEDLSKHKMQSERLIVSKECCDKVNAAHDAGRQILAVGSTVQRALEVCVGTEGHIMEYDGYTNKFIFPPYDFCVATAMLANFQLPYSTMLILTTAFGGYDLVMKAYSRALKSDYKFGPFGDAILIVD
ncbi:MAG: tRNA preQ1(34) S-adenosylmethionine ribosyltransferase-isomerase QueA [Alloprevotella sp.]|nr:tRNA preQ1(34) S-adenosylmethionine ribosyltransferase-isomerase QueA [Alloprevotella sp.]